MASIIKADDDVVSGQTGIVYTADTSGTLELQATSGLVTLQNVTGGVVVAKGTTAQRPGTPVEGTLRYNTTTSALEVYKSGSWGSVGGGATGGTGNAAFYLNDTTITANYTVPSGQNAMTAGPVTVNDGIVVTVSDGSTWTVV